VRVAPLPRLEPQLDTSGVSLNDLLTYVQEALDALPASPVGEVVTPITVTIQEQITRIEGQLAQRHQVRFREFLSEATTRVEIIVTLWAVLELVKQERARVRQEELFGEIFIEQEAADCRPGDSQPEGEAIADAPATGQAV
jgi:chromatin segregation and condensation protein Rec8/ScpA/Scc1 (kleisin family)